MIILSTTRLTDQIEQRLKEDYPQVTFKFMDTIDQAAEFLPEADVLMTYGVDIEVEHIEQAKRLKWVMVLSAGVEKMPKQLIEERNIAMTNVRGIHKIQMAEYALAMLLSHYQNQLILADNQKKKVWDKTIRRREITGRTLAIIGAGAIGEELARLGQAFRMKTIAVSHSGGPRRYFDESYQNTELKQALQDADFVVSILPGTEETEGYYQSHHFEWMKDDAVFLNMGRGTAVAEDIILKALDEAHIEHAILDVTPIEPLPAESRLWTHEKVTLTPHVSGNSEQYVPRAMESFRENLDAFMNGKPVTVNKVNLTRGY